MDDSKNKKIYVAGHRGMVGSAIVRQLKSAGFANILTKTHAELDLTNQLAVREFMQDEKPDQIYLAAAKVGGIYANSAYPAEFIYENLMVQSNVIHQAFQANVKKILFLGSSCIYPKNSVQPIDEEMLLTGVLEKSNEPYAIAKIAGIKLCESYNRQYGVTHGVDYRSVMPTNLYGPGDNYHPENSHVIPALIHRFHQATKIKSPQMIIWGSGTPMREFLYVDDMAAASILVMNLEKFMYEKISTEMQSHINVGFGIDLTIKELAEEIKLVVGYKGDIKFDSSMPDGMPRKLLNSEKMKKIGWQAKVNLKDGLRETYKDYLARFDG